MRSWSADRPPIDQPKNISMCCGGVDERPIAAFSRGLIMWTRIKAACRHSLTIAWGYALALMGVLLSIIDNISDALGDPGLRDQISAAFGDTRTVGRIFLLISLVTIVARLRSLKRTS
jgi:hypothetical protein